MQKKYLTNYKVKAIPKFEKELKQLSKKYPSLKNEFIELVNKLKENPEQGIPITSPTSPPRVLFISECFWKGGETRLERRFAGDKK